MSYQIGVVTPVNGILSRAEEAAMELALIRPDLVEPHQVQILAQALKNRVSIRSNDAIATTSGGISGGVGSTVLASMCGELR